MKTDFTIRYLKSRTFEEIKDLLNHSHSLLNEASVFELGKCTLYDKDVFICTRKQLGLAFGAKKWVCMLERTQGWCIGKDGNWHFEKIPSSRTDEFIEQTRFDTQAEAREAYQKHIKRGIKYKLYI